MQKILTFLIFNIVFSGSAFASFEIPDCCKIQYFEDVKKGDKSSFSESHQTLTEMILEGGEPQSLLASTILGLKIGILVGTPLAGAAAYVVTNNFRQTMRVMGFVSF